MNCPYCSKEMKSGNIINDSRVPLRWKAENEKLSVIDYMFTDKGALEPVDKNFYAQYPAFYCDECKKIIMDAEPKTKEN